MMKLRLKGNTVRLRLDQDDLRRFAEEGRVEAVTRFSEDTAFRYILQTSAEVERMSARTMPGQIVVSVPADLAEEWIATRCISLEGEQPVEERGVMRILVEKDLGCQHRGAKEKGMFDHLI